MTRPWKKNMAVFLVSLFLVAFMSVSAYAQTTQEKIDQAEQEKKIQKINWIIPTRILIP